jgi:hypothetical protein
MKFHYRAALLRRTAELVQSPSLRLTFYAANLLDLKQAFQTAAIGALHPKDPSLHCVDVTQSLRHAILS